jgi:hypothetical protein
VVVGGWELRKERKERRGYEEGRRSSNHEIKKKKKLE